VFRFLIETKEIFFDAIENNFLSMWCASSMIVPNLLETIQNICDNLQRETWWRSWLRHYATSRKNAGSIPDEITRYF
jgi:hypothetical protein